MRLIWILLVISVFVLSCNNQNVESRDEWKEVFTANNAKGTFALFDNSQGKFHIYNIPRYRDSSYLPASTFKIVNSLIALGTGKIFSDTVVVPWSGTYEFYPNGDTASNWNKDMNMQEAFKVSNVGFYREMARRTGRDTMQKMLDSIGYGNRKIGSRIDNFWLDNSLKITADEQLGLVKRLYFRQLQFQNREMDIVKQMMIQKQTDKYVLAYKTGWGIKENGKDLGWVVGWIEENRHPYFFVLNMELNDDSSNALPGRRMRILETILQQEGFYKGLK